MWRHPEFWLCAWTAAAAAWWTVALALVARRQASPRSTPADDPRKLSIFKPVPALTADDTPARLASALESFVSQLDNRAELLLGVEEQDGVRWQPVLDAWRAKYPAAEVNVVCVPRPAQFLSPKVSWFYTLARQAAGELWMWSDADMVLPAGGLRALRGEFVASGCALLTTPYAVRRVTRPSMLLEALFVNAEFYPGVLACREFGTVRFAMGAGMMFEAEAFRRHVEWEKLGCRLADDNALGGTLAPVRVSDLTLETLAASVRWRDAVQHYLRWHKTVRWCRPSGYAGELLIMPVLGWLVLALLNPVLPAAWLGLAATMQLEVSVALLMCRRAGCPVRLRHLAAVEFWSGLRAVTWLACWLPWPVVFRSQKRIWWGLYRSAAMGGNG
jgi:ceramide glucosyltransferase